MDLLFSKYASPYLLLDQIVEEQRLCEFLNEFANIKREEELVDVWKHKVFDKGFKEFKESLQPKTSTKDGLETAINNSYKMLNGFVPS